MLRFRDRRTARIVELELARDRLPKHFEVEAAELLVDFAIAFDLGQVEPDEIGFVCAWRVPAEDDDATNEWCRSVMPGMQSAESDLVLA